MCFVGLNFDIAGTVNSPSRAMQKNEQTMHAKIAASRGLSWSMREWNISSISSVNGARFERLEAAGASLVAPSKSALYSGSFTRHSSPCSRCHARTAAA